MLRNRKGFTLIELLIVVVIIGILAAIALPKFGKTREAAYYTTVKSDLNSLRSAEEMYYQTSKTYQYTDVLDSLEFNPSSGVVLGTITLSNNNQAWSVTATHQALDGTHGCVIGFGELGDVAWSGPTLAGTPAATVTDNNAGAPVCTD